MPKMIEGHNALLWLPEESVEPDALEMIKEIASMPFIFKHLAIMPDCHLGKGATIGTCLPTKGAIIPAAVGVDIGCFVAETKVPLLDGTQKTLKELTDQGGYFWVYSVNQETQRIVPGKARALKTRSNAELVKVTISGGDEIECTPDHEFMLSDGSWKEAKDLQFNDSLMPLYRNWSTRDGYEKCSNGKGNSVLTHKLVFDHFNSETGEGNVVHHDSHNHFDNRPENLVEMTASEHSIHHRKTGNTFNNDDPEFQKARMAGIDRRKSNPEERKKMADIGTANIKRYMEENPDHFASVAAENGKRESERLSVFNTKPYECECGTVSKNPASHRWHKERDHTEVYNHKVISVENIDRREDVYCLQVEEHHNFALAAGIFVHNCGMMACQTTLKKADLPEDLSVLRKQIERDIPLGIGKQGVNREISSSASNRANILADQTGRDYQERKAFDSRYGKWYNSLGSLGGGNHFIEIVIDEEDSVWAFLHSGSRGVGNKIAQNHIKIAKNLMKKWHIYPPNSDLAYLPIGTEEFDNYVFEMEWAQRFALANRDEMMDRVIAAMRRHLHEFVVKDTIRCHHNFTQWENHFGENILVSRKGAISARDGEMGLIPGSMGTRSYVVRGRGNPSSFYTAPHGAGRRMSRGEARRTFTMEDFDRELAGVEVNRTESVLDELPSAYKDVDVVIEQSKDLVDVVHTFRQVVNVKGS